MGPQSQDVLQQLRKTGRMAVWLSALAYPGAGQLVQRRWLAAGFFISAFTAAAAWFIYVAVKILKAYYDLALHFEDPQAGQGALSFGAVLVSFGTCMVVYFAGLLDTVLGNRRMQARVERTPVRSSPPPC
jgi:hypothetical protein